MATEKIGSSYRDEDYDVILENEPETPGMLKVIATIILTAVVVSGIGYVAHIYIIDDRENNLKSHINRLESRVIAEIRASRGADDKVDKEVKELESKLKKAETANKELENQIILILQKQGEAQATSTETEEM